MQPKRCILYARVSTPRQAELYSLNYQIEQERQYVADIGGVVVKEVRDDQSGRKMERDGLTEAREMLAHNEADALITWKIDRLHRNYVNMVVLRDEIRRLGKELHYAQMRMKSGTTAKQRLPEDVLALVAEIEADEIVERTTQGRREKADARKWLGQGRPPYGYRSEGRGHIAVLVIDTETAPYIVLIFEWYVCEGLSTYDIAKRLTAMGVPTPNDRYAQYAANKQRGYAEWSRSTVCRIIRQSAYKGTLYQFRLETTTGRHMKRAKDEWVPLSVPAIVSEELFDEAQRKMDEGRIGTKPGRKHEYLVARRIDCVCGYRMKGTTTVYQGKHVQTHHSYYRCPGKRRHNVKPCDQKDMRTVDVDARVWEWVHEDLTDPKALERKLRERQAGQRDTVSGKETALRALYENKVQIEQQMEALAEQYARRKLPERILDKKAEELSVKLQLTEEEIARITTQMQIPLTDERIASLVAFSEDYQQRLPTLKQTFAGRRGVIEDLDVTVQLVLRDDEVWLKLKSVLHPKGRLWPLNQGFRSSHHPTRTRPVQDAAGRRAAPC